MISGPKTLAEARKYRYGVSALYTSAYKEGRCAQEVSEPGRGIHFHQCARKNGYGPTRLYCAQHNPAAVAARLTASADRYNADMDRRAKSSDIGALHRAAQLLASSQPSAARACRELAKRMKETK